MSDITPAVLRKWKIFSKWTDEELDKVVFVYLIRTGASSDDLGGLVLTSDDEVFLVGCPPRMFNGKKNTKVDALLGLGLKKVVVGDGFCVALSGEGKLHCFWGKSKPAKIADSAYVYYQKYDATKRCQENSYYYHYHAQFELGNLIFDHGCKVCIKSFKINGAGDKSSSFGLVRFHEVAIRCPKCRVWCTPHMLGEYMVNYCSPCNYLPHKGDSFVDEETGPAMIDLGKSIKIVDVVGGSWFFVALTNLNFLVLCGTIDGTYYEGTVYNPDNAIIKAVSCGSSHFAILDVQGDVYTCGLGKEGQLGYNWTSKMGYETLRRVPLEGKAQKVCCGYSSTVCLMDDGSMMCFGSNMKLLSQDVLALNQKQSDFITKPAKIMLSLKVIDIVNAPLTNIYCAKTNVVTFMWGRCSDQSPQPRLLPLDEAWMAALANLPAIFSFKDPCTKPSTINNQPDSELYGKKFLSDLTLKLADGDFPVHRLILRTNSEYFRSTFEGNDSDGILDMTHYNPEAYKCLLKYFYQLPPSELNITDLFDLYLLASSYKETDIAQEAFAKLTASLSPTTVLPLLRKAKKENCADVLDVCNSFIDSAEFKHILAEKVSKDLDNTLSVLELLSGKDN